MFDSVTSSQRENIETTKNTDNNNNNNTATKLYDKNSNNK